MKPTRRRSHQTTGAVAYSGQQLEQAEIIGRHLLGQEGPAVPHPPSTIQYSRLIAGLERAKAAAQKGQDELAVAVTCLIEVSRFVDADPRALTAGLTQPLARLAAVLRDVQIGARPALLFDRSNRAGRPSGTSFEAAKGAIAALVDAVIEWGETKQNAGKLVADELRRAGVKQPKRSGTEKAEITSKQVLGWRDEVNGTAPALMESTFKDTRAIYRRVSPANVATTNGRRNFIGGRCSASTARVSEKPPCFPELPTSNPTASDNNARITQLIPDPVAPEYGRIPDACRRYGLSRSRLYLLAGEGLVRFIKVGNATLVDLGSVRDYLAARPAAQVRAPQAA